MKIEKRYQFTQKAVGGMVALIIGIAFVSYYMGAAFSSTTTTVASTTTTHLEVTTFTSETTHTFTVESYIIQTTVEFQTVTQQGPDSVLLSGHVSMKTPGTTPNIISFVSAAKNQTFNAQVQDGTYSIGLPNRDYYNVYVNFGTVTANILAGKCLAGAFGLFNVLEQSVTANWMC